MLDQLKCIIIDDEPPAIRLLEKYVSKISFLQLEATFTNPLTALAKIEQGGIDVVFLDIQMPEITGIQLSKIISAKTKIVFTTAYPNFAIESYDVSAIDYLIKPIAFERFYAAVLKVKSYHFTPIVQSKDDDFLFVKTDGKNKFVKVFLKDILYIEGLKNYVSLYLKEQRIVTYSTLKYLAENLPEANFVQTHKSYIVSLQHIDKIDNDSVWIHNNELPIGNTYKKAFYATIETNQL